MTGYTIEVPETERAVDMLTGNASRAQDADTGISQMPRLPAVQAGESIAPASPRSSPAGMRL